MKNLLESHGISSLIKNETMQGIGIGELGMCWPELWIKDSSKQNEAKIMIENAIADSVNLEEDWTCTNCAEVSQAAFNLCWNCNQAKPVN